MIHNLTGRASQSTKWKEHTHTEYSVLVSLSLSLQTLYLVDCVVSPLPYISLREYSPAHTHMLVIIIVVVVVVLHLCINKVCLVFFLNIFHVLYSAEVN